MASKDQLRAWAVLGRSSRLAMMFCKRQRGETVSSHAAAPHALVSTRWEGCSSRTKASWAAQSLGNQSLLSPVQSRLADGRKATALRLCQGLLKDSRCLSDGAGSLLDARLGPFPSSPRGLTMLMVRSIFPRRGAREVHAEG